MPTYSINIQTSFPWSKWADGQIVCWFAGHLLSPSLSGRSAARHIAGLLAQLDHKPQETLAELRGNFAFVIDTGRRVYAAVDTIRSIPIFYASSGTALTLSSSALRLHDALKLTTENTDDDQAFLAARSGYTLGQSSLYRELNCLRPGEFVVADGSASPQVQRYYIYRPWRADPDDQRDRCEELAEVTLNIFRATAESARGRPIAIPLSGGLDSRLIAAGLKQVGYDNVICFSYGLPGNWETQVSQQVAEIVGYPWFFLPLTHRSAASILRSNLYSQYLEFSDSCVSVPVVHEFAALSLLRDRLSIEPIIINGQSGDFLTGGHVPSSLCRANRPTQPERRRKDILAPIIAKHFSLWGDLLTERDRDRLDDLIWADMADALPLPDDSRMDYGLVEFSEWQNRQCRYVVTNQRIYEFFNFDWRLPLWDREYLRFWETVSSNEKLGQALYKRMLKETNWGGVWRDIPVRRWPSPTWLRLTRPLLKGTLGFAIGRKNWKEFDRRYLSWWSDIQAKSAIVPYLDWARDRRRFRHAIAFLAEAWLLRHGRDWSGARLPSNFDRSNPPPS